MTSVTIDSQTYNTAQAPASYPDGTSWPAVKSKLPSGFKFDMGVINLLKTDIGERGQIYWHFHIKYVYSYFK